MRYSWVGFANRRTQSECRANGLRNGTDFRRPALSASPARSPHPMHPTVGAGFPTCTPRPWANTAGKKPAATSDTPTTVLSRTEPVVFQPFRSRDLDGQPNNDFMQRRHSREKRRRKGKEAWCGTITVIRPQPLNGESGRKEIARGREEKFQRFFRASFFGRKQVVSEQSPPSQAAWPRGTRKPSVGSGKCGSVCGVGLRGGGGRRLGEARTALYPNSSGFSSPSQWARSRDEMVVVIEVKRP